MSKAAPMRSFAFNAVNMKLSRVIIFTPDAGKTDTTRTAIPFKYLLEATSIDSLYGVKYERHQTLRP